MDLNGQMLSIQLPNKRLDFPMAELHRAEGRLMEVAIVNPTTANELSAFFNAACSLISKYIGLIEYEIVKCKKEFDLAKAAVVLDKLPAEIIKLRDQGIRPNDDWREAYITRDPDCALWLEHIEELKAVQSFLQAKNKSFERAYYSCYKEKDRKQFTPITPINGHVGQTYEAEVGVPMPVFNEEVRRLYGGYPNGQ